jgi:VanZ family protein
MTSPSGKAAASLTRRDLRFRRLLWALGWIMVLGVLYGCLEPARYVPNLHVSDKLEHGGAYFLLALWFGGLLERRSYPLLTIGLLVLGALIEFAQGWMGWGRSEDIHDFLADAVGVLVAMALLYAGLGAWMIQLERMLGLTGESS